MHITYQIRYLFLKMFVFVFRFFFGYCILVSDLFRRVTDIQIFWFKSKQITNRIKNIYIYIYIYIYSLAFDSLSIFIRTEKSRILLKKCM